MLIRSVIASLLLAGGAAAQQEATVDPDARAAATERRMHADERSTLTHGIMALPLLPGIVIPPQAILGAGYVAGLPRLGVPALTETDASLGVAWVGGIRKDGATALPSGMAMGSTWNPDLVRRGGAMIADEARAKGFNALLAGGINLVRDPRNGRTFEYLGEDPLQAGLIGGAAVDGIQSRHVLSTVKHFALNAQETGRHFVNGLIDVGALRMRVNGVDGLYLADASVMPALVSGSQRVGLLPIAGLLTAGLFVLGLVRGGRRLDETTGR